MCLCRLGEKGDIMICDKCGNENTGDAVFCIHCGTRLENRAIKKSVKRKINRKIIVVLIMALVLSGLGVGICFYQTSATFYLKEFADMLVEKRWKEAYDCLEFCVADREEYAEWAEKQLSQVQSYRIEKMNVQEDWKEYKLILIGKGGEEIFSDSILLKKQNSKRFLLFPTWKVEEKNLLVEDVDFIVPEGAEFLLNEEPVLQELFTSNGDGTVTYKADYLFAGTYTAKVKKHYYIDLEKTLQINSETVKDGRIELTLELKPDIVWRKAFYDFLNAVANGDMDTINNCFTEASEAVEALQETAHSNANTNQDKAVHFSLYYLDDNDIPEILLSYGEEGPGSNGVVFAYREDKIQPIWFEGEDKEKSYFINEVSVYIKEKKGVVLGKSFAFGVGDNEYIHVYRYDGEGMVMTEIITCNTAQLAKEEGSALIEEYDYDWDKLKSSINGKEVSAKEANKKINEYLNGEECVWDKVADITAENLERALSVDRDEETAREEENSAETEHREDVNEDFSVDSGETYMEDQWCSGYKMLIPDSFQYEFAQDYTTSFKDNKEKTCLIWTGCRKEDGYREKNGFQYYPDGESFFDQIQSDDISYSRVEKEYCCYSYIDNNGFIHYEAYHFDDELMYGFELSYSEENKKYYDPIIEKLAEYIVKNKGKEE